MIFKTKKYYKKKAENLDFHNYCLQITLQDTIEESERLKSEIEQLKSEIEQLKSEKTIHHETIKTCAVVNNGLLQGEDINKLLYKILKDKVIDEIKTNFTDYVKLSPITYSACYNTSKQFATILIERKNL